MNNYAAYWKHYADFKGRATRSEFWVPILINFAIALGLIFASVCTVITVMMSSLIGSIILGSLVGVIVVWRLVRLVPDAAIIARRTHDVGITGWVGVVLYICNFIPYADIIADVLLIIIGCMAADSADWSSLAWQPEQPAKSAKASADSKAANTANADATKSDTPADDLQATPDEKPATRDESDKSDNHEQHYEQLSLDLDGDNDNINSNSSDADLDSTNDSQKSDK